MVEISRQYLSDTDRTVKIRQAVVIDKGTQPNFDTTKTKLPYQSGHQIFLIAGFLGSNFLKFSKLLYIL